LAFIADAKLASQKANFGLPNSEAFYETLFIRLPTLIRQYDIPKDWKDKYDNSVSHFVPGFKGYLCKLEVHPKLGE
jgi:hypothetical protein